VLHLRVADEKLTSKYGKLLRMQQKLANVGGPLDLRLADA